MFALAVGLACGDSTGGTGSATESACPVGSQGCACTQGGGCDGGLTCQGGLCQPAVEPTSSGSESSGSAPSSTSTDSGSGSATMASDPTTSSSSSSSTTGGASTTEGGPKLDVGVDTTTGVPAQGCTKIDMLFA